MKKLKLPTNQLAISYCKAIKYIQYIKFISNNFWTRNADNLPVIPGDIFSSVRKNLQTTINKSTFLTR
ncbi:hypothetical protein GCM10007423_23870 [Dyadobacter endophyticus]|uniref:Uncharacterized protein n=1 Tax=Dyadobacter endophyticus TaxID=1749036 RepID=A0ABQ1YPB3_9BACT|nr:hypothetical protein GCM10007423_23870 [Dyadobacter endophyticus]